MFSLVPVHMRSPRGSAGEFIVAQMIIDHLDQKVPYQEIRNIKTKKRSNLKKLFRWCFFLLLTLCFRSSRSEGEAGPRARER